MLCGSIPDNNILSEILLSINNDGDAAFLRVNSTPGQGMVEPSLLSRPAKGERAKTKKNIALSLASFGRNIRTKTDLLFDTGVSSETACIARHYDMIGDAQHFGHLSVKRK